MLKVITNILQLVKKFKYLGMVFTSDERQNRDIDSWIVRQTRYDVNFVAP